MNLRLRSCAFSVALAALATALPAAAQFAKPEDAIEYRQSVMTVMGTHFGRLGAMVQGKVPFDAKAAQANANIVLVMSMLPFSAFGPGTDLGHDTKAKPDVWKDPAKFQAAGKDMQDQVVKLDAAAKTGNLDLIKAAFGDTAKTCKGCHDNFREK
ncbi:MAG: cytochrome c [Rhizobacter sp.]|nr:cytochrome c [Burkholderiaceae bacterium]MCO5122543.1 cytochrome c [Rhizobacter sp.]